MDSGWAQAAVAVAAAFISVAAAGFSMWQAKSARRQADAAHGNVEPTFHIVRGRSDGRSPWRFEVVASNYNRKPLVLDRISIDAPGYIVYRDVDSIHEVVRATITAVKQAGRAEFDLRPQPGSTLPGIAPNAGNASILTLAFAFGAKTTTTVIDTDVPIRVTILWSFVGDANVQSHSLDYRFLTAPD